MDNVGAYFTDVCFLDLHPATPPPPRVFFIPAVRRGNSPPGMKHNEECTRGTNGTNVKGVSLKARSA